MAAQRFHGRNTRRTGSVTVASTAGSKSLRRRRCRIAAWTVDLDRPVLVAMVCRLTDSLSLLPFAAWRKKYRYTMNVAGRRSCPTTGDQDRALKFYTEKLGFEVSTDQLFDAKQRWIELRIGNSGTRVVLFTPEGHEGRIGSFFNGSFACDDVGATYRQLKARGVEFEKPPEKQPWGEFAIFKDPDGNKFVLSSPS